MKAPETPEKRFRVTRLLLFSGTSARALSNDIAKLQSRTAPKSARLAVPQPAKWERIGDEIDAAIDLCAVEFRKRAQSMTSSVPVFNHKWPGMGSGKRCPRLDHSG